MLLKTRAPLLLTPHCLVNRDVEYPNPLSEKFRTLLKRFDAPEQLLVDEIYLRSNGYFGKNSSYQTGGSNLLTLSRCKFALTVMWWTLIFS
jgi:hypothetical protein